MIIPPHGYWSIEWMSSNLIRVQKGENRYLLFDTTGKVVQPFAFTRIEPARQQENIPDARNRKWRNLYVVTKDDSLQGLIDSNGVFIVPPVYRYIGPVNEDIFWVLHNGKYGFCNLRGQLLVPLKYERVGDFNDGMNWVYADHIYRIINSKGEFITNDLYDGLIESRYGGLDSMLVVQKNKKYGIVDFHGRELVPCMYTALSAYSVHLICAQKDSLWGCIDVRGNVLAPIEYSWIDGFSEGYAWAMRKGQYVILDSVGHETIPSNKAINPRRYSNYFRNGCSYVLLDGKQAPVNTQGQVLKSWIEYSTVGVYPGWFEVSKDKKFGALDAHEQLLIPLEYDDIVMRVYPDLFLVKKNGLPGYVGTNGVEYFEP